MKNINKDGKFKSVRQIFLIGILLVICVFLSIASKNFLTIDNIINVLRQSSYTAIAAVGMTMVIIIGQIDLSTGSLVAVSGMAAAFVYGVSNSSILSLLSAIFVGIIIGYINGIITAKGNIPGFISTLAMMTILRGLAYIVTGGNPIAERSKGFINYGMGYLGPIPIPVIIMIIVVILGIILMSKTKFGRYVYAVGGNKEASKWSGLNVDKITTYVYLIMGMLSGISGLIIAARLGSGQPSAGTGFEMDCIAAAVIGGTSMSGGKGKVGGTLVGVLLLSVLTNGMTLLDINTYWQQVVKGVIIVVAVLLDTSVRKAE